MTVALPEVSHRDVRLRNNRVVFTDLHFTTPFPIVEAFARARSAHVDSIEPRDRSTSWAHYCVSTEAKQAFAAGVQDQCRALSLPYGDEIVIGLECRGLEFLHSALSLGISRPGGWHVEEATEALHAWSVMETGMARDGSAFEVS